MERRQPAWCGGVRSGGTSQRNQGEAWRYVPYLLELRRCPPPLPPVAPSLTQLHTRRLSGVPRHVH